MSTKHSQEIISTNNISEGIEKMDFKRSILFFGFVGVLFFINFQFILPFLQSLGVADLYSALLCMAVPILILLLYVFFQYKKSKLDLKDFLYVEPLNKKQILIILVFFIVTQILELVFSPSTQFLSRIPGFSVPEFYPDLFKPGYNPSFPVFVFMGVTLHKKWYVILVWSVWLVINILGEEILWRGYALKRMELVFGKWAWLVNGLMWNFIVHFFMRWSFITLLPISLLLPYMCQKTKSIWPGVIIHGLGNLLVFVLIIPGIFT